MLEAADHPALLVVVQACFSQPCFEAMEVPLGGDLHDYIDVVGGPEFRRSLVTSPWPGAGPADEAYLAGEVVEPVGLQLKHPDVLEVHARMVAPRRRSSS